MSETFNVLVMEQASAARCVLLASLEASGFAATQAHNPDETVDAIREGQFDLVLLDIEHLPAMSSVELCHQIRANAETIGILLMAAPHFEKQIVQALEAGADDYITKPFRTAELISRCHVVLHRTRAGNLAEESLVVVGNLQLDLDRRQFRKAGKVVHLTPTEFNLLTFLMKNQGTALTHSQLLRTIWGPEYGQELEYLRAYIRQLRKKIEEKPSQPKYLLTEPWVGYRFCGPASFDEAASNAGRH